MPQYIEYTAEGEIIASGRCQTEVLELLANRSSHTIMEVEGTLPDLASFYVDPETQAIIPKPPCPSENHEFDLSTKTWIMSTDKAWEAVREKRNRLIRGTDWRFRVDTVQKMTDEERIAWETYCQALRDITLQTDPSAIIWPEKP